LVEANIEQERAEIIKQTNEHNQLSAFGSAYVDLANQVQSLVGTFYDRRKGKYPFYKSVQHKDCIKQEEKKHHHKQHALHHGNTHEHN